MTVYHTILADTPWNESGGGRIKRGADRHYPLLKVHEVVEAFYRCPLFRPVGDCHLYLWVTKNHLRDGLLVLEALGFRYATNLVWVKDRFGLGRYFRGQHELCLFAVRSRQGTRNRSTPTVIEAKRRKHSQKPDSIHRIAEECSYPPRLEMFARTRRPGWDIWGDEVEDGL